MKYRYTMHEAGQALRSNRLRSGLTVVGIIVGIFAVTAMLALGEGLSQNVLGRMSAFSQGDVLIRGALTPKDLAWVAEQPYTQGAVGILEVSGADFVALGESFDVTTRAVLGDFAAVQQFTLAEGATYDFTDPLYRERHAVVTTDLDDAVRTKTGTGLMGQVITVGGQQYEIVASMKVASAGFSRNDGTVYLPYRSVIGTLTDTSDFSSVGVKLKDTGYFAVAGEHLLRGLNASRHLATDSTDLFSVSSAQSIIESAQETTSMISLFLGIVGGIALFVGGIGTMNMMLTTVTERTKEIGLRKALGARRVDILLQILTESVFLTLLGGALGIALTFGAARVANDLLGASSMLSVIVSWRVVALATGVAIVVGVVFGLYPASRASALQPVDALRAE